MDTRRWTLALSLMLLAGCAMPSTEPADDAAAARALAPRMNAPVSFDAACHFTFCYESSIAVDHEGRLYATAALADGIEVSEDGGATWRVLPAPPLPLPPPPTGRLPDSFANDALVQTDAQGRLYFSALVSTALYGAFGFHQVISGLQVARSDDAGASWAVNTFINAATQPQAFATETDRQWLAFGPGETVYLLHRQPDVGGIVARSDDGGRTFGEGVVAFGAADGAYIAGHPVTDAEGRIHWPFFRFPNLAGVGEQALEVATSEDEGATWHSRVVDREHPGSFFPVLTIAAEGDMHIAWRTHEDTIVVASSHDGGASWGAPVDWTSAGTKAAYSSPWVLADNGRIDVLWFAGEASDDEESATLTLSRSVDGGARIAATNVATVGGTPFRPGNTDFAHGALLPDGRVALIYAHAMDENVKQVATTALGP